MAALTVVQSLVVGLGCLALAAWSPGGALIVAAALWALRGRGGR